MLKGGDKRLFNILDKKQLSAKKKIQYCDHVIVNEKNIRILKKNLLDILKSMNEIFLDTETTGLSFKDGHKIVEIACVETKDLVATGKVFHKLINPKRDVPLEAYKIHGFSREFLSNKESFDLIADEFLDFIKGKKIIIHNAPFDISFLNGELLSIKKKFIG